VILFIIFLDGLIDGTIKLPYDVRNVVMYIGMIWLILIPLASIITISNFRKRDVPETPIVIPDKPSVPNIFRSDQPIQSQKDDLLARALFAQSLGDTILKYQQKDSIVLGLLGEWGSGKTSVINMTIEHIVSVSQGRQDALNPYIVRFDPWNYADQNQLIRQFFKQLSVTLRRIDYGKNAEEIGIMIETYARLLDPLACVPSYGPISAIFSSILKFFGKNLSKWGSIKSNDLLSTKYELNQLLDRQNRKILIVIDDIDRLSDIEIRQMFQLVKSLGDFHNTIYLLAFDKAVVVSALNRVQEGFGADYLEKVVQVPFEIPVISKMEVDRLLFSLLQEILKEIPEQNWDSIRWGNVYIDGLSHFFNTIRDINRYINTLKFNFSLAKNEIDAMDFFAITALQVFIPEVYYGIRDNKESFSGILDSTIALGATQKDQMKARIDEVINRNTEYPPDKVKALLKLLFPKLEGIYGNTYFGFEFLTMWRKGCRVAHPEMFDTFFKLSIPESEISRSEIETILKNIGDQESFKASLLKLNQDGKIVRFLDRLEDYTRSDIAEKDIIDVVEILMNMADIFPTNDLGPLGTDTSMRVLRICHQLIRRLDTSEKRFQILKNAIEKAETSLYSIARDIGVESDRHKHSNDINSENEWTVDDTQQKELELLIVNKIEEWAGDGRLAKLPQLIFLLNIWKEWGDASKVKLFVDEFIKTDEGLVKFISGFLSTVRTRGLGNYIATISWHISIKSISSYIELKEICFLQVGIPHFCKIFSPAPVGKIKLT
jgi:predicted KAP-like P-loop ATPase